MWSNPLRANHRCNRFVHERITEGGFVRKMMEERAFGHLEPFKNPIDARGLEAALVDLLETGLEQPRPREVLVADPTTGAMSPS